MEAFSLLIREMSRESCLDLLARMHLGRLACVQESQPYVVPFYFVYKNDFLYSFSTVGQKISWMRANPLICVEVDEIVNSQEWMSLVIFGRYEELPDTSEYQFELATAYNLMHERTEWWEPAYAKTILHGANRSLEPVFYRIRAVKITGHCASP
jgi:uncharacterized protein